MSAASPAAAKPGLYVHLPWCVRKCPYCDFNSHEWRADGALPTGRYTDALLAELAWTARRERWRPFASVFFGGGTPSLFPARDIERILDSLRETFGLLEDAEVTLEANPGAVERGSFEEYKSAGVNRISLGAQSFDAGALAKLGRIHSPRESFTAVDEIRAAGIDELNIDVMVGLPGQTPDGALADANTLIDLAPEHISHYQLTIEPNTLFHARPPTLPDGDLRAQMQERCQALFAEAGYHHYEVSAHGRDGARGRHNLNYWRFGDYLGIGAGAHGKRTEGERILRRTNTRHPQAWMDLAGRGEPAGEEHEVAANDRVFEYALNALRLIHEPLDPAQFAARTGLAAEKLMPPVEQALARGLMAATGDGRFRSTDTGRRFLNDLQAIFLPDDTAV